MIYTAQVAQHKLCCVRHDV